MKFADLVKEATVSANDEENAAIKVAKYIGRKLGEDFHYVTVDGYSNADGMFIGFLFISDSSVAIRLNWKDSTFRSINYWTDYTSKTPDLEIFVKNIGPEDASFVQILPKIVDAIKEGNVEDDMYESMIVEKTITYQDQSWNSPKEFIMAVKDEWTPEQIKAVLKQNGNTYSIAQIQKIMGVSTAEEKPAVKTPTTGAHAAEISVAPGKPEKVAPPPSAVEAEKVLSKTKYSDPEVVFEDLDELTQMVATGYCTAFLITGQGGVGKSYNVEKVLSQYGTKGEDYVIMKGKCTPLKMYNFLYKHYDRICVFDDCDSIFDSKDGINVLKGVLDTNPEREVSWDTTNTIDTFGMSHAEIEKALAEYAAGHDNKQAIPSFFGFEGAVIFISNLTYEQIYKKDRALPTRCTTLDITLRAEDIINRIKTCLPTIKIYKAMKKRGEPTETKDITNEELKKEVFDYMMTDEFQGFLKEVGHEMNFRTFIKVYQYRAAGLANWKRLAKAAI